MPPKRADLVLASNIPHGERDVLVLDRLDIETCADVSGRGAREAVCGAPIVGMVVTISPNLSLYRMVVFPAASRPT